MDVKVIIRPLAERDLQDIIEYIARDNPQAAARVGRKLLDLSDELASHPRRGMAVRQRPSARKIGCWPYVIFYRFNSATGLLEILRFWHSARDPKTLRLD